MVVFQQLASASPALAQLAITAAQEGALALIVRQPPPPVPSQTFGFSHTSRASIQVQTPQTFEQMRRRFAPATPLASTPVPHLLPLAPSARILVGPDVTPRDLPVDFIQLPFLVPPSGPTTLTTAPTPTPTSTPETPPRPPEFAPPPGHSDGPKKQNPNTTFSQGALAEVFVHQEITGPDNVGPSLVSMPFAEFAEKETDLLQKQTRGNLTEIERLKLDRAQRAVAIVRALRADAQTFKNGLSQLFFMTANRIETHPVLAAIVNMDLTNDIVIRAHVQMEPVYRALNVLSDSFSAKSDRSVTWEEFTAALTTLKLADAFQKEFPDVSSGLDLSKPDAQKFIVNELLDGTKRDRFYAVVDTLVLKAIQERYPESDMTDTREVLGRLGRKFGEPKAEEPKNDDVPAVENAGASASASDHGAGNSGTGQ